METMDVMFELVTEDRAPEEAADRSAGCAPVSSLPRWFS